MGYLILALFIITIALALVQERISKQRLFLYAILCVILILIAGLRPVGIDPDSSNYEYTFLHHDDANALDGVEYSYIFLSQVLSFFTKDVHIIFLFYATLGVGIKFYALRKLNDLYFIPIIVYLGYYFVMHECMQIRTGVLSALFLLALKYIGDRDKKKASILILIGTLFHYSGLLLVPFLFLSNKILNKKKRLLWASSIIGAYTLAIIGFTLLFNNVDLPYIGNKLALYQQAMERGKSVNSINLLGIRDLLSVILYVYLLLFYDSLSIKNRYFPLMMKIYTISLFVYITFSFFPVLAQRTYMLYNTLTIILYSNIYHTFKQKWIGTLAVAFIAFIYLNYSLPNVETFLLWKY